MHKPALFISNQSRTHERPGYEVDVLRHGRKYIYHPLIPRSLPSLCHIYWCHWTHFTELQVIMGASQHSLWMINSWQILVHVGAWSSLLWQVYTPTVDYIRHCRQYMNTHCWLSITKEVKGCVQQTYISEIAHPTGSSSVNYSFPCTHQLCSFLINKGVLRHEKYAHHALIPRFLPSLCHIYDWCTHFTELAMEARQCSLWTLNSWQMLVGLWSSLLWRGEGEIKDQQEKEHSKRDKHSFSVLFSQLLQFFFCGVCMQWW